MAKKVDMGRWSILMEKSSKVNGKMASKMVQGKSQLLMGELDKAFGRTERDLKIINMTNISDSFISNK